MAIDTTSLQEQLRSLVERETFSGKGLEGFQAAIAKVAELEKSIASANERIGKQDVEIRSLTEHKNAALLALEAVKMREAALGVREKEITNLERGKAVSDAVAVTWEKACGLVFRNTTVRSQMHGTAPRGSDANPNNYHPDGYVPVSEDVTKTVE